MQKRIFVVLVFILNYNLLFACDLCTVYLGLRPNDYNNSISLRHRYRLFDLAYDGQSNSIGKIGQRIKGVPKDKHGDSYSGVNNTDSYLYAETYNSYDIAVNIYLNHRLQLNVSTYFADNYIYHNDSIVDNIGGIGDINLLMKYQLINSQKTGDTLLKGKFLHRLTVGAGVTLPTGNFNKQSIVGFEKDFKPNVIIGTPIMDLDPHMQAGTGSFSYLMMAAYMLRFNSLGINLNGSYKINTTNKNEFRFANRFNSNITLFSLLKLTKKLKIMPQAGFAYEASKMDVDENQPFTESGGKTLFGNLGLKIYVNKLSFGMNYYVPVYQHLYGDQPLNKYRVVSQINYYF